MDYNVTFKIEILNEVAAYLRAKYWKYMDAHNIDIDDNSNVVALLAKDISALKKSMLIDCETLDDLKVVENKFSLMKSIIERLESNFQPIFTVIAGVNGAGKTTLFNSMTEEEQKLIGSRINPDELALA